MKSSNRGDEEGMDSRGGFDRVDGVDESVARRG